MPRKKVLLVDDSATVVLMMKMILTEASYDVVVASNGEEALALAAAEQPDLILMDVVMPRLGGFEACRTLRRQLTTKTTPIILVTTRGEPTSIETGYTSGCTDYVTKPVNGPELLAKVRNYLGE